MTDQELIAIGKAAVALVSLVMETARTDPGNGEHLITKYGESCTRKIASEILGKRPGSVSQMIDDGRLRTVPGSTKVDVRSIIQYLSNAQQADYAARQRKRVKKTGMYIVPSR